MDRAAIKALATAMLQNKTSIAAIYFDEILDGFYSHSLVDAVPSMARRGVADVVLTDTVAAYELPETWRALDADYAYLENQIRVPVYTSQEAWLKQQVPAAAANPSRVLLYSIDSGWLVEVSPVPSATGAHLFIPGTFYRGALPAEGTPNFNEALALVYGLTLHIATEQSLSDIKADAQAGLLTQLGLLRSQYASERFAPTSLPPARDF